MSSHFDNLRFHIPDLSKLSILDVGSGKGKFLISAAKQGAKATGLEVYRPYIEETLERAKKEGVKVEVKEGIGENILFSESTFDFVNLSEVLEHVDDPRKVMSEVYRVLKPGGYSYTSVPNRLGMKDQHFHLWFLNWMPRSLAEKVVGFFGRHKDYEKGNGRQRISEMHYFTWYGIKRFMLEIGFHVEDMRIAKLRRMGVHGLVLLPIYFVLRHFYFDSFHLLLKK